MAKLSGKIAGDCFVHNHYGEHLAQNKVQPGLEELAKLNFEFAANQVCTRWNNLNFHGPVRCTYVHPKQNWEQFYGKFKVEFHKFEHFLHYHAKFGAGCVQFVRCQFPLFNASQQTDPAIHQYLQQVNQMLFKPPQHQLELPPQQEEDDHDSLINFELQRVPINQD